MPARLLVIALFLLASATVSCAQIHLLLSGGIAGQALHADALDSTTSLSTVDRWDFGDAGSKYNVLNGFNAAHVYNEPGSYVVTLTEGAQVFHAHVEIAEAERRTYFVADDGNDSNDGLTTDRPLRTIAGAGRLVGDHCQFFFRRGDTFEITGTLRISARDVLLGAYPPLSRDQRPRIVWTGPRTAAHEIEIEKKSDGVVVRDLVFDSVYNKDTERDKMPEAICPAGRNTAVLNCRFLNVAYGVNCELVPTGVLIQDCDAPQIAPDGSILPWDRPDVTTKGVTGIRAYFAWVQGRDVVLLGNTIANSTREHCIRIGGASGVLISYNHLQNLDREKVDSQDIAKTTIAAQIGDHLYAAHNVLRDGPVMLGPLNRKDLVNDPARHRDAFQWAVFEDNDLYVPIVFEPGFSHGVVRGNSWTIDDGQACFVNGYNAGYNRYVTDVTITNNSAHLTSKTATFIKEIGTARQLVVQNNFTAP